MKKSGATGLAITIAGAAMLGFAFLLAYETYASYLSLAINNFNSSSSGFLSNLSSLLDSVMVVMFLGIMGWLGSIFLVRGVDFMKVDRGVGIITFKVDKGLGVVSGIETVDKISDKPQELALEEKS
jgi:hypothetical protein